MAKKKKTEYLVTVLWEDCKLSTGEKLKFCGLAEGVVGVMLVFKSRKHAEKISSKDKIIEVTRDD
jgi:hypothetical protein